MPKIEIKTGSRFQRKTAKPAAPAPRTKNVKVKFVGKANPEQFSTACQTLVSFLQDMGVHNIQNGGSFYFAPLDKYGNRMDLIDENGEVLEEIVIEIPEAVPVKTNGGIKRLAFPGSAAASSTTTQN